MNLPRILVHELEYEGISLPGPVRIDPVREAIKGWNVWLTMQR